MPLGIDFEPLGVDIGFENQFWPQDVDVGHLVFDFGHLGVVFAVWELNLSL